MSGTRILIALGVLLAMGGAAFLLLNDPPSEAPEPRGATPADPLRQGGTLSAEDAGESDPRAIKTHGSVRPIVTGRFREETPASADQALTLLVRDENEEPVAGAVIKLFESETREDGEADLLEGFERVALRTGITGTARLTDIPDASFRLVARQGSRLGFLDISRAGLSLPVEKVIDLASVKLAEVTVIDRAGRPVPHVWVSSQKDEWPREGPTGWTRAPDGRVTFEITPLRKRMFAAKEFQPRAIVAGGATFSAEKVPWNEAGVTRAKIEIDRGVTLRVLVTYMDGTSAPGTRELKWKPASEQDTPRPRGLIIIGDQPKKPGRSREFQGSETVVSGFEPGSEVKLTLEEHGRCPVSKTVFMPATNGLCEVTLIQGDKAPRLEIPVVDEKGTPLRGRQFTVKVEYDSRDEKTISMNTIVLVGGAPRKARDRRRTDGAGILTRFLEPDRAGTISVRHVKKAPAGVLSIDNEKPLYEKSFPALAAGSVDRLSPLVIPSKVLAASGRVIGSDGEGVVGARVVLTGERRFDTFRSFGGSKKKDVSTTSGEDGVFSIFCEKPPGSALIHACNGHEAVSAAIQIAPGDTGLVLQLRETGTLEGKIDLGAAERHKSEPGRIVYSGDVLGGIEMTFPGRPKIVLRPVSGLAMGPEGKRHPFPKLSASTKRDGSFTMTGLPPGTYDAQVKLKGFILLEVPGVVIREGSTTRDPRLDGITIADLLMDAVVHVRDPGGRPKSGVTVKARLHGNNLGKSRAESVTNDDGQATLVIPRKARADVTVSSSGFKRWHAENVAFPLEVTLDPGCVLVVEVEGAEALRTEDKSRRYEIELHWTEKKEGKKSRTQIKSGDLDLSNGKARLSGVEPRSYDVVLAPSMMISYSGEGFAISTYTKGGASVSLGKVTLTEGQQSKTIRYVLTPGQLAKLNKK